MQPEINEMMRYQTCIFSHYRLLHGHPYSSFAYNDRVFVSGLASISVLIFLRVMTCNQNHDNLGEPDHQKLT